MHAKIGSIIVIVTIIAISLFFFINTKDTVEAPAETLTPVAEDTVVGIETEQGETNEPVDTNSGLELPKPVSPPTDEEPIACTQEAKICPDGSFVSRSGPNCAFAQCPTDEESVEEPELSVEPAPSISEGRTFNITGSNFKFDVEETRVSEGDTVTINFDSAGGSHSWVVDEFDAVTDRVNSGDSASVTFVASAAGTYEYYCSVGSHRSLGMVGTLIVE